MAESLLSSTYRVEVPFIKVTIGDYTFGVKQPSVGKATSTGFYEKIGVAYPNYVQTLQIEKINGKVNTYTLQIEYPIEQGDDPNFFEKIWSSVSGTRAITFSYGDLSAPNYIYKNESAIITDIKTGVDTKSAKLTYTITAVSACILSPTSRSIWQAPAGKVKPSKIIKDLLRDTSTGLADLFWGMSNYARVEQLGLIDSDDAEVMLESQTNMSVLDYVKYLVSCMIPQSSTTVDKQTSFYAITVHDESENEVINRVSARDLGGPYFKVKKVSKSVEHSDAYSIDIGYPGGAFVTNFSIDDNENYSLYYNYSNNLSSNKYITRLDENGNLTRVYSPAVTSVNSYFQTRANDKTWWAKVTEYPISATMEIRGLLKPALLMEYVRLNVYFFGRKHISSGLYIITKQVDSISRSGYKTTLSLTRVAGESKEDYQ